MKKKKGTMSGLGIKIAGIGAIIIIVLALLNGALIYYTATVGTERAISNFSTDIAENIADHIDPKDYERFLEERTDNELYWEMRENLDDFREKSGVLYVYTLGVTENNDIEILLDGMPKGSEDAAEIGELIEVTTIDHVAPVLEGETSTSEIVKDPNYGDYLSAFAPILDDSGEVIGILGVDINADQIGSITNNVIISVLPILIPMIIVFILIALFVLFLFIMKSLKPLNDVTWIAGKVADGDIHTAKEAVAELPVHRKDEIGRLSGSFQHMVMQLEGIIRQVQSTSEHVAASSEELYASAVQSLESNQEIKDVVEEVAAGSSNQLRSSGESVRGMEEMSGGAQQIAESALSASDTSAKTLEEAEQGRRAIDKVLSQMEIIGGTTEDTAKVIHRLNDHSDQIVQILDVITGIAEQTNLLALNAAIEAARAGEHGRGFAVVSDEIRHLADQSKVSVEQIGSVINTIHNDMKEAVTAMELGKQETQSGQEIVKETELAFQHILEGIKRVTDSIQDVSASSEEMAAGSEQVTSLIEEMEAIAKETATNAEQVVTRSEGEVASMEEISNASQGLSEIAQELQDVIQKFKI